MVGQPVIAPKFNPIMSDVISTTVPSIYIHESRQKMASFLRAKSGFIQSLLFSMQSSI